MKKLQIFKPSLVTREIFPNLIRSPEVINHGECFIWAYSSFIIFEGVELWDVKCHAFIKYKNRFYDSETLRGSPDWQDLPATELAEAPARSYTEKEFTRMWQGNPKRYATTWDKIRKQAQKVLEKHR